MNDMPVQKPVMPPASEKRGTMERLQAHGVVEAVHGNGVMQSQFCSRRRAPARRLIDLGRGIEGGNQSVGWFMAAVP
jgi:hypothetical protein